MRLSVFSVADQETALEQLAEMAQRSSVHPLVRETANAIVGPSWADCQARDDSCELEAIFNAVKHGTKGDQFGDAEEGLESAVAVLRALRNGVRYVADPRWADSFTAPFRLLEQCKRGVCAGDCDDHAALVAALCAAVGFHTGLRVWGPSPGEYVHVYAVVGVPKRDPRSILALDTTVPDSHVGWEPPAGSILTAWME